MGWEEEWAGLSMATYGLVQEGGDGDGDGDTTGVGAR